MILQALDDEQISAECTVCGGNFFARNQGLGRATFGAWKTRHQHYEQTAEAWKEIANENH